MRTLAFCLIISCCTDGWAQVTPPQASDAATRSDAHDTYIVQLSEYEVDGPIDVSRTAAEIVASLTEPGAEPKPGPIETIRLSTLSGSESMVQFGKQVRVRSGAVSSRGSTARQTQNVQMGTLVRVTTTTQAGKVAVKLLFESSRLDGEAADDSPPDISTTEISTTLLLEIGKPTLVGGVSSDSSSFILLTVTR